MANLRIIDEWQGKLLPLVQRIPVSVAKLVASALILVGIASSLGHFVWMLVPVPEMVPVLAPTVSLKPGGAGSATAVDLAAMQSWPWFGKAPAESATQSQLVESTPAVKVDDEAAETRLSLILRGIAYASEQRVAVAFIENQGKAEQYRVGDKIKVGGNVTLAKVLREKVILDNSGRYESLYLFDLKRNPLAQVVAPPASNGVIDHRSDRDLSRMAGEYKRQLLENPASLADVIRVSMANDATTGEIIGYRVSPGTHRKQFSDFGFQPGDIVTSINGVELSDTSKALEFYRTLRDVKEASFTIKRGEETVNMMVNLDSGE